MNQAKLHEKSVLCIHDISCLGKCSLSACMPIISSAGVEVGLLPTALLSTQTGGLNEYTYLDLTDEMRKITRHWKKIGIRFNCVFSGFLGSSAQIELVKECVDTFTDSDGLFICDPAMADDGKLYNTFDESFISDMSRLCKRADIIVPNETEAKMLLGIDCKEKITDENASIYLEMLINKFDLKYAIITGISVENSVYTACMDNNEKYYVVKKDRIDGMFHSTGDVFASAFTGCLLNGLSVYNSIKIATEFVSESIKNSVEQGRDSRFGLSFEQCLKNYSEMIEDSKK